MKSNKILASLLMATSALVASCSKDGSEPTLNRQSASSQTTTFSAELPLPAIAEDGVRTSLDTDGHTVLWKKDTDQISVFADGLQTVNNAFTATEVVGNEATFEGSAAEKTKYFAIYPYSASNTFNQATSTFTATLPSHQTAVAGSFADQTSIAVATLENASETNRRFKFRNATALLKINFSLDASLAGKQITEITLRATPDATYTRARVSGSATVTAGNSGTRPATTITNSGQTSITLSGALEPTTGGKPYYMVVPTTTLSEGFTLTFLVNDGSAIVKQFPPTTFTSNRIKSVSVELRSPEERYLTNLPLIQAIERRGVSFVKEADGRVNYYKNIDAIERATMLLEENNTSLTSLQDLEYFINLTQISFTNTPNLVIGEFSTQEFKKLETLVFDKTKVTSIDVHGNKLKAFRVEGNPALTSIVVRENHPALAGTNISNNQELTTLNISALTNLQIFNAQSNVKIGSVDLSGNTGLTSINVSGSRLQRLDVSNNPLLTAITAGANQLTSIDVSRNTRLQILDLSGNKVQSVDLQNNPKLSNLNLADNLLAGDLDLRANSELKFLTLNGAKNAVTSVDVSRSPLLESIALADITTLQTLDLSQNKRLKTVSVGGATSLETITGLNDLPALELLLAANAHLTSVDISGSPRLNNIQIDRNYLSTLDISRNPLLMRTGAPRHQLGNQRSDDGQLTRTITVTMTAAQKAVYDTHTMRTHETNARVIAVTQ